MRGCDALKQVACSVILFFVSLHKVRFYTYIILGKIRQHSGTKTNMGKTVKSSQRGNDPNRKNRNPHKPEAQNSHMNDW